MRARLRRRALNLSGARMRHHFLDKKVLGRARRRTSIIKHAIGRSRLQMLQDGAASERTAALTP